MAQAVLSVRMNSEEKLGFEKFCAAAGMNVSVAVNMFVKAVLREQKLPFEVRGDPFYSSENMARLERSVAQLEKKKVTAEEANAFLDKYGDISAGTSEASVLAMREALKNDVW